MAIAQGVIEDRCDRPELGLCGPEGDFPDESVADSGPADRKASNFSP